jgi:hypothetical protein
MAYNFAGDANCKALWRFEDSAITTDSKGTNTLDTSGSPPTADTANFQEGAASANFAVASSQCFKRDDADLDAGFPLKDGDSAKLFSCTFWWTPTSNSGSQYRSLVAKYRTGYKTINICHYGTRLKIQLGYGTGSTATTLDTGIDFVNGQTYHVAVTVDGTDGTLSVRVWDVTEAVVLTYSTITGNALFISSATPFAIGTNSTYDAGTYIDGKMDELAVFNDILSDAEIDEISGGVAVPPPHDIITGSGGFWMSGGSIDQTPTEITRVDGEPDGFVLSGEGGFSDSTPAVEIIVATGGFGIGGLLNPHPLETTYPVVTILESQGGFGLGSTGALVSTVPVIPHDHVVGVGGFILGGSGVLPATAPLAIALIGSGGFKFGGFRPDALTVAYPSDNQDIIGTSASLGVGGEGVWGFSVPSTTVIVSNGAVFQISGGGEAATLSPPLTVITGDGGFVIGGTGQVAPGFDTWVLTGNGFEPSLYSNFAFNAYAQFRGQYYGAKADGIYLLSGPDDDGEEIHPGVRIGPTNLGTANQKRLRTVSVGEQGNGAQVRVQAGDREGVANVVRGHATIARNLQSGVMTIDIADFDAISHVEIIPLVLSW